jgi:hypothetical protein
MRLIPGVRVLVRTDGALQVGVRDPLILSDLSAHERRFLERFDTVGRVSSTDRVRYATVLERLSSSRFIEPDPATASNPPPRVAINDGGPIGGGIALVLALASWALAIDDDGRALQTPRGTYDPGSLAATRQAAVADTIRRMLPEVDVCAGPARSDVAVIVSHGAPLIEAAVPLMAHDVPHIYVTTDERGAQVGPLVVPGQGACGTCVGLVRVREDPDWPLLALQLTAGRTLPASTPDVAAQAAALVSGALGWWRAVRDGQTEGSSGRLNTRWLDTTWLDTVWTLNHLTPPRAVVMPPHPDCGCGAAGPVGDELAARRARMPGAT